MAKILVVDDQRNMRTTLSLMLRGAGHDVSEAADGEEACEVVQTDTYDLVLTDLKMGGRDGIEVLRHVKEVSHLTEVIVMTAYGTIESAVEAMRIGAYDYIQKPFSEEELLVKVDRAVEKRTLAGEVSAMAAEFRERYGFDNIIGRSAAIRDVLARIVRIAPTDTTVLITGESGTGKELVARAVHVNSTRADKPFVSVNCAAISETLLESELFGHVRGAYTGAVATRKGLFEEANGGTFFFDEIAETPPAFQAKLLRAIQEGEIRRLGDNKPVQVDVRIIAATNQDLQEAIAEKRFRQDLYYRLNVARFMLPPLRERREDIPLLSEFFKEKYAKKMRRRVEFGEGVVDYLTRYEFPGNVRECENMVEQGVALSVDGKVRLEDIVPLEQQSRPASAPASGGGGQTLQDVVDRAERDAIQNVLRDVDGNKEKAAEVLGLSATTLWRKMKRLNVHS
ncbi:sigma-54-dependent transcriptional regulator [Sandaracinus amylolyticus]|uniref:Response regulator of zinc sigma-54-dependent two-component system n=1 Tax=Sandaracinus amylolyticus TaxID=927083 RepID=A0A0F6W3G0_9BACT|nr:sigma-54 dependent transcriptional regulator [Sandaracinus amylolyticus]AKF06430.1 Response regulator of zinc sigma-54-dependent two-component system [Sandaracinus amylolyticus]